MNITVEIAREVDGIFPTGDVPAKAFVRFLRALNAPQSN
jgi:hypothetical protein